MPRRGRPSTDITSRPATDAYRRGYEQTFGAKEEHLGKTFQHSHTVIPANPETEKKDNTRSTHA